jgi:glycolate oxidase FAD binding subunit
LSLSALRERIEAAAHGKTPVRLRGGGTKDFYGNESQGEVLDTRTYTGIVTYEPTELVVTARCGTPLAELEAALAEKDQCLAFEPPHFGAGATLGGCVAAGLSGPRRATAGALRDFILGIKLLDGRGRVLAFGGQVMKNVAGYDVSRLVAGSLGTLGMIAEASIKVSPRPSQEMTLRLEMPRERTIEVFNRWAAQPLPICATAWVDGVLCVRLAGAPSALRSAAEKIGGEPLDADPACFWASIREHRHPFFHGEEPLWRMAVRSGALPSGLPGREMIEWNGSQRWLKTGADPAAVRTAAKRAGGHATLFRAVDRSAGAFAELDPVSLQLHRSLKAAFDPAGILNRGRLHPDI